MNLTALLLAAGGLTSIPSDYEIFNRPSPELVVANPFFKLKSDQIKGVKFSIDGSWHEQECSSNDRNGDGKTCGKPVQLDPGSHVVAVLLCSKPDCSPFGRAWNTEAHFTIGLRERVTLDLAKLDAAETDEQALAREKLGGKPKSACLAAAEEAFYANTCRADGVVLFKQKLDAMEKTCRATWTHDTDLMVHFALWDVAYLDPRRCYKAEEIKRLPPALVEWSVSDGFWPPGTVPNNLSSWHWAREGDDALLYKLEGEELRKRAYELVQQWIDRQQVVDQLIDAYLKPDTAAALIDAAVSGGWDLNPSTPKGHRLFLLTRLDGPNGRFRSDAKLKAVLAKGGGSDSKMHCAYRPEVRDLVDSYVDDEVLSKEEWQAVLGFVERTPGDESLRDCEPAFRKDVGGPISQEARLMALGKVDCAASRDEDKRGELLSSLLNPDNNSTPKEVRLKVMRAFADCVAF